jgi:cyclophilin family peptidyl-prolyl cis-trans isomerase
MKWSIYAALSALILAGCGDSKVASVSNGTTDSTPAATASESPSPTATPSESPTPEPPSQFETIKRTPKDGEEVAVMDTDKGRIILGFLPDKAPNHVKNFKKLANSKFYDGTRFHRVIPTFMIQGGDPNTKSKDRSSWGMGGPAWNVKAEFNNVHHARGILSMARSQDPDSAGSQFFICQGDAAGNLDGQYTAFGYTIKGLDVVDKIVNVETEGELAKDPVVLKTVKIVKWPVK